MYVNTHAINYDMCVRVDQNALKICQISARSITNVPAIFILGSDFLKFIFFAVSNLDVGKVFRQMCWPSRK